MADSPLIRPVSGGLEISNIKEISSTWQMPSQSLVTFIDLNSKPGRSGMVFHHSPEELQILCQQFVRLYVECPKCKVADTRYSYVDGTFIRKCCSCDWILEIRTIDKVQESILHKGPAVRSHGISRSPWVAFVEIETYHYINFLIKNYPDSSLQSPLLTQLRSQLWKIETRSEALLEARNQLRENCPLVEYFEHMEKDYKIIISELEPYADKLDVYSPTFKPQDKTLKKYHKLLMNFLGSLKDLKEIGGATEPEKPAETEIPPVTEKPPPPPSTITLNPELPDEPDYLVIRSSNSPVPQYPVVASIPPASAAPPASAPPPASQREVLLQEIQTEVDIANSLLVDIENGKIKTTPMSEEEAEKWEWYP